MKHTASLFALVSVFSLLPACSSLRDDDSSNGSPDPTTSGDDSNRDSGATHRGDAGATAIDGGTSPTDAGHARDGGRSDAGSASTGEDSRCVNLSSCCPTLPGPDQGSCNDTVANDDGPACDNVYDTLTGEGFCNGPTANCAALDSCCQDMSGSDYTSCEDTVADNNDSLCANTLLGDRSGGLCGNDTGGGAGPECSALADCCPTLPDPNAETACDGQVRNGIESNCSAYLGEYQSLGYCN